MTILAIIIIALAVVALYPVLHDYLKKRRSASPAYVEGLRFLLDGKPDKAIPKLKEAVQADPENVDAYVRLGSVFMEQGDTERGLKVHENLGLRRNLGPEDARRVYRALARDYLKTDRKLKAIGTLEELARIDRHDSTTLETLFRLYVETESWSKCEEFLKELKKNTRDRKWLARLWARYGHARAGDAPETARSYLDEAMRTDPSSVEARLYLGDLHLAGGRTDEAIRAWQEVLSLDPARNARVRRRLERAFYEQGRYDDIVSAYEDLLRKRPDDEGLAVALARIYQKKQETPRAVPLLERFVKPDAGLAGQITLASLCLDQGDSTRARRLLDGILDRLESGRDASDPDRS